MANNNGAFSKVKMPKLDKKNFLHWSTRIKAHLRHKFLIKYINKPAALLAGAAAKAIAKKHAKVVDIHIAIFYKDKVPGSSQSLGSLKARWGVLQRTISKFRVCVNQVEHFNQSGASTEDKLKGALQLFSEDQNNIFELEAESLRMIANNGATKSQVKIMNQDLTKLNEDLKEFFKLKKQEILNNLCKQASSSTQ
ncbi:hypothetical protein PCANC_04656 [Puccinia coronata f. sp. avenae]|uniref:No apical meristem-associated C-terminal domain-containing protein n=1 Tax=Puccinia coronata f. sp. avenae TaxID=200324 RepID=A0A2N5W1N1_9BASI|nr:hypothetical protein PCANC_04656 [Puccinia coronata f. sp. avenae]